MEMFHGHVSLPEGNDLLRDSMLSVSVFSPCQAGGKGPPSGGQLGGCVELAELVESAGVWMLDVEKLPTEASPGCSMGLEFNIPTLFIMYHKFLLPSM